MIWFTSDTHFGHHNVMAWAERPWDTLERMNRALITNINSVVGLNDELYILGDFSYKMPKDAAAKLRKSIRCKYVHLVPGNHDKDWSEPDYPDTFVLEPPIKVLEYEGQKFVLSHFPIADWESIGSGSIHLHGHIHSRGLDYNLFNQAQGLYRYDVGCDANNYMPVSIEEIIKWFDDVECCCGVSWKDWVNATRNEQVDAELREMIEAEDY